jgi:hypothetical protein
MLITNRHQRGIAMSNFTIVVNWKAHGFGCAKACPYCNWRHSPLLPHGGQSDEAIVAFIQQCRKSFITISGGADPLYRFDVNGARLLAMAATVRNHGFRVRLITREVQHVSQLRGSVDCVSVSLDADVLAALPSHVRDWAGMEVEFSLVLPPLPTPELVKLRPQYAALHRQLGQRLVLRENLNSIHALDFQKLSFGHSGIVFVPKSLCLSGRYLTTVDCVGHDIIQDHEALAAYLMNDPGIFLFGGFVKHLVSPTVHPEYSDIDVIALDARVLRVLADRFGFAFTEVSTRSYPRYFLGKSRRAGKPVQLVLMTSDADALQFVMNAQYDADRVAFSTGTYHFDGEERVRRAIHTKRLSTATGARDLHLFNHNRPLVELRHRHKLLRRGFTIDDEKESEHASDHLHHTPGHGHGPGAGGA